MCLDQKSVNTYIPFSFLSQLELHGLHTLISYNPHISLILKHSCNLRLQIVHRELGGDSGSSLVGLLGLGWSNSYLALSSTPSIQNTYRH
jgi:hypothetical protein